MVIARVRRLAAALGSAVVIASLPVAASAQGLPAGLAALLPGAAEGSAAAPGLSAALGALLPHGQTQLWGYLVAQSSGTATFAGSATGALQGQWTATVGLPAVSPFGALPPTVHVGAGQLTLTALGQPFTIAVAGTTLTLSGSTQAPPAGSTSSPPACAPAASASTVTGATYAGTSSAAAATTTAASATGVTCTAQGVPVVVPDSEGTAEVMLQVLSAAYHAAAGNRSIQKLWAAEAASIVAAFPALSALGPFPWPESAVIVPPRILSLPDANGCGDASYAGTLRLSLGSLASGTVQGQFIEYRADTAGAGCVTYATAVTGQLAVATSP